MSGAPGMLGGPPGGFGVMSGAPGMMGGPPGGFGVAPVVSAVEARGFPAASPPVESVDIVAAQGWCGQQKSRSVE